MLMIPEIKHLEFVMNLVGRMKMEKYIQMILLNLNTSMENTLHQNAEVYVKILIMNVGTVVAFLDVEVYLSILILVF